MSTGSADGGLGMAGRGDTETERLELEYRASLCFISDNIGGLFSLSILNNNDEFFFVIGKLEYDAVGK